MEVNVSNTYSTLVITVLERASCCYAGPSETEEKGGKKVIIKQFQGGK
jgi:hypothetical protein